MIKSKNCLSFFVNKVFFWKFLNIGVNKQNIEIEKIIVSFNIRDQRDVENSIFLRFFHNLEIFCGQKGFVGAFLKGNLKTKNKNTNLTGKTVLRGIKSYIFFEYLIFFLYPLFKKNFINLDIKVDSVGNLSLLVKDIGLLPGLSEEIIHTIKYPLKINVIFKCFDNSKGLYLSKELGLLV